MQWTIERPPEYFTNGYERPGDSPAGDPAPLEGGDLGRLVMDLTPLGIPTNEKTFAVRIRGTSMTGAGIEDGDTVIIEKRSPKPGDIVLAVIDNQVTLKRLVGPKGQQMLHAENPNFDDIPFDEESTIQGVAVGLIRRL
jgi:DNA polymerase V